jgi:glyoxylase-like metal-dependent hydrolase (beta-lactamase superfamily II)
VAFVVDPQRDIDRILEMLEADGVRLTHVFETHIHNDYVTGEPRTGAGHWSDVPDQRRRRGLVRPDPDSR